jgi:hypothetical protein
VIALALLLALDLTAYRQRLEGIDAQLARNDAPAAASAARTLLEEKLEQGLFPDAWVLQPIADGTPHRARLQRLLETLRAKPSAAPQVDPGVLDAVRKKQAAKGGAAGGELGDLPVREPSFFAAVVQALEDAAGWVWRQIVRFFDWLGSQFPDLQPEARAATGRVVAAVFIGVGLILVLIIALAVRVGLRRDKPAPLSESALTTSKKDDDPLSRTAVGWEQRAAALAAAGRFREAIRAWYHALLVHAASAGVLQYQRGRTNWEYVHLLSPALAWRPIFAELTRLFEREWYGRAESREEELQVFKRDALQILSELRSAS